MTFWERLVAEYAGISLPEVEQLDYFVYLTYRRDAWITHLNQTKEGREYLDNAYRLTVTRPERSRLREQFSNKKG